MVIVNVFKTSLLDLHFLFCFMGCLFSGHWGALLFGGSENLFLEGVSFLDEFVCFFYFNSQYLINT